MEQPVFLLAEDIPGVAEGGGPGDLAGEHRFWSEEVAAWGPWTRTEGLCVAQVADRCPTMLSGWLSAKTSATGVIVCVSCSSALDLAWKLQQWGVMREWDAVIAARQWAGRGQVRRPWSSLPGNLHVVWRQPDLPRTWEGPASLIPVWLVARTMSRLGLTMQVKWPNDLLWQGSKVGGILLEQRGGDCLAGLGLNLVAAPETGGMREETTVPGAALDGRISPVSCWNLLVSESVHWYQYLLPSLHPEDFIRDLSAILAWKGRRVLLHEHGRENGLPAVVLGLSVDGGLVLSADGSTRTVFSGDIRLVS